MKRILLVLAGAALLASANAGRVFNNQPNKLTVANGAYVVGANTATNFFGPGVLTAGENTERGDEVVLTAGTTLTEMTFYFITDVLLPTGTENWRVRIYQENGPVVSGKASPGTVLYDGTVLASMGWRPQRVVLPNVVVPATFAWTLLAGGGTVSGTAGNQMGLNFIGPPTGSSGTSDNTMWRRNQAASAWLLQTFPGGVGTQPYGSVGACFWDAGGPAVPYDSTSGQAQGWTSDIAELGDDICFEGSNRLMTSFTYEYIADVPAPAGTEAVTVRFYNIQALDPDGSPQAAPFLTVGPVLVPAFTPATLLSHTIPLPATTFPNDCIYTLEWNTTQTTGVDEIGSELKAGSSSGNSMILFWIKDGLGTNGFGSYWFGNPTYDAATFGTAGTYNNVIANLSAKFLAAVVLHHTNAPNARLGGTVLNGVEGNVDASDNVYWQLRPGVVFSNAIDPIRLEYKFTAPGNTPSSLVFTSEDKTSSTAVRRRISAWDYTLGTPAYVQLAFDQMTPANTDLVKNQALNAALNIGPGNEIKVLVGYRATTAVFSYPWIIDVDEVKVTYTP
jgi:hypothetical protein